VQLVVEGRIFEAHRLVLAASSPFMKALLSGPFRDALQPSIHLPELAASVFEAVLEFIYSGQVTLSVELMPELLQAACRFQIAPLQAAAQAAAASTLTSTTYLDAWRLALALELKDLAAAAKKVALKEFGNLVATSEFEQLPVDKLEDLLKDDDLDATEDVVFEALEKWVAAQSPPPPHSTVERLLSWIRVAHVDDKGRLESSPLFQQHPSVLFSAYRKILNGESTPRTRCQKTLTFEELEKDMLVKVMQDEKKVKAECEKAAPGTTTAVEWNSEMKLALGKTFHIRAIRGATRAARLDTSGKHGMQTDFLFPASTILRADIS